MVAVNGRKCAWAMALVTALLATDVVLVAESVELVESVVELDELVGLALS